MTPAERLNEVLRYTKTNVKTLSERLGYARPQGLYDVAAGRTKSISYDLARKIITAYPEFRNEWLVIGEGKMLKDIPSESASPVEQMTFSGEAMKIFINMSETISRQEENISKLTDMVNRLTGGQDAPQKELAG